MCVHRYDLHATERQSIIESSDTLYTSRAGQEYWLSQAMQHTHALLTHRQVITNEHTCTHAHACTHKGMCAHKHMHERTNECVHVCTHAHTHRTLMWM